MWSVVVRTLYIVWRGLYVYTGCVSYMRSQLHPTITWGWHHLLSSGTCQPLNQSFCFDLCWWRHHRSYWHITGDEKVLCARAAIRVPRCPGRGRHSKKNALRIWRVTFESASPPDSKYVFFVNLGFRGSRENRTCMLLAWGTSVYLAARAPFVWITPWLGGWIDSFETRNPT